MDAPLPLLCQPSRRLRAAVIALHGVALWALMLADLPGWLLLAGMLAVLGSAALQFRHQLPLRLRAETDGSLSFRHGGEDWQPARVMPDTHVTAWLVVLHYRPEGTGRTSRQIILGDSLPVDDFRRLRVWLRWRVNVARG